MSLIIFAETSQGKIRKTTFEAASYAVDFAKNNGISAIIAVAFGACDAQELAKLGEYGVSKVCHLADAKFNSFNEAAYASGIAAVVKANNANYVILSQTFNGRALAPRLSVKIDAALAPGVIALPETVNGKLTVARTAYSGKAIQDLAINTSRAIFTLKSNAYPAKSNPTTCTIENFAHESSPKDFAAVVKNVIKASDKISLTEAEVVVSAGRGLKGPENWKMIEDLADLLNAATACSKPVADVHWRPHHEHVGQTGIQVAPNVYIAIGISGAIQHLGGVNSSKTIVVINKDPEAPFFKAADVGIIADAFEFIPALIKAIKEHKK